MYEANTRMMDRRLLPEKYVHLIGRKTIDKNHPWGEHWLVILRRLPVKWANLNRGFIGRNRPNSVRLFDRTQHFCSLETAISSRHWDIEAQLSASPLPPAVPARGRVHSFSLTWTSRSSPDCWTHWRLRGGGEVLTEGPVKTFSFKLFRFCHKFASWRVWRVLIPTFRISTVCTFFMSVVHPECEKPFTVGALHRSERALWRVSGQRQTILTIWAGAPHRTWAWSDYSCSLGIIMLILALGY